jgi:hypothetical protein
MPLFPPKRSFNLNINLILKTTIYQCIVLLTSSGKYLVTSTILNENSTLTLHYVNLFSVRTGGRPGECDGWAFK